MGTNKKARSHLAMAKPTSWSEHSRDTAAAPQLAWALTSGALGSGFCCCNCCPQPSAMNSDVPCPCSITSLAPGLLYERGARRLTSLGRRLCPSCKGCWNMRIHHSSPQRKADSATSPKTFRIENFSSLGTRGHQMTDDQREWQKPRRPEAEGRTAGHPSQPQWRADQMSPLPGVGCGS